MNKIDDYFKPAKKTILIFSIAAIMTTSLLMAAGIAQTPTAVDRWEPWRFLIGEWMGEGGEKQSVGAGTFSFSLDLQDNVLIRKNHSEYPAIKDRPAISHDDLMIVYQEPQKLARAIYFDNEGHVINYSTEFSQKKDTLTFLSDLIPNAPRFRLAYIKMDSNAVKITFEMAAPGKPDEFMPYLEGTARKIKTIK